MKGNFINENDTIYDIVNKYPQIKDKLIAISDKFQKLNNPLLFNTVAKITTVKKAASVANIYLYEFLYELNDAIGMGKEFLESKKSEIFSKNFKISEVDDVNYEKPSWFDKIDKFEIYDVSNLEEPFFKIVDIAKNKNYGEGFCIIQNFKPLPIIEYLKTLQFENYIDFKENKYFIYFYKIIGGKNDNK